MTYAIQSRNDLKTQGVVVGNLAGVQATRTLVQLSIFTPFSQLHEAQRTPFESHEAVQLLHPELRRPNPGDEPQLSTKTKHESTHH